MLNGEGNGKEPENTHESLKATENQIVSDLWQHLKDEVYLWEARTGYWLLEAGDPTRTDWMLLQQRLASAGKQVMVGEYAHNQAIECLACGQMYEVSGTVTVEPCSQCGCDYFTLSYESQERLDPH